MKAKLSQNALYHEDLSLGSLMSQIGEGLHIPYYFHWKGDFENVSHVDLKNIAEPT